MARYDYAWQERRYYLAPLLRAMKLLGNNPTPRRSLLLTFTLWTAGICETQMPPGVTLKQMHAKIVSYLYKPPKYAQGLFTSPSRGHWTLTQKGHEAAEEAAEHWEYYDRRPCDLLEGYHDPLVGIWDSVDTAGSDRITPTKPAYEAVPEDKDDDVSTGIVHLHPETGTNYTNEWLHGQDVTVLVSEMSAIIHNFPVWNNGNAFGIQISMGEVEDEIHNFLCYAIETDKFRTYLMLGKVLNPTLLVHFTYQHTLTNRYKSGKCGHMRGFFGIRTKREVQKIREGLDYVPKSHENTFSSIGDAFGREDEEGPNFGHFEDYYEKHHVNSNTEIEKTVFIKEAVNLVTETLRSINSPDDRYIGLFYDSLEQKTLRESAEALGVRPSRVSSMKVVMRKRLSDAIADGDLEGLF